ncbi:MAG TPA: hypothetical protein VGE74_29285 [Gemmata sp.]
MTNDAKLGMLVGVVGVVMAAVFLTKPTPQPVAAEPPAQPQRSSVAAELPRTNPSASVVAHAPRTEDQPAEFPSTPVVRVRKDVPAQPTARHTASDEEP